MKNIKFRKKTYTNLKSCINHIATLDYSTVKGEKIVLTMSIEELQEDMVKVLKSQLKETIEPMINELKELYK